MRAALSRLVFLGVFGAAYAALGCGGGDLDTGVWALDRRAYSGKFGLPYLSPANDSRLNLRLLMLDAHPQAAVHAPVPPDADVASAPLFTRADFAIAYGAEAPSGPDDGRELNDTMFSEEEGSRCVSAAAGGEAFAAAVAADKDLPEADRKALTQARAALQPNCAPGAGAPAAAATSPRGRDYVAYLAGADAFYRGDFDAALASFGPPAKSGGDWLGETARYMLGRAGLNKAQAGAFEALSGAPEPNVRDRAALANAETALKAYLADFPRGRYAGSARGLLRRLYWLGGDKDKLAAEYGWQIAHLGAPEANLDAASLAQEIDSKFLDAKQSGARDPTLMAVEDLMRMRKGYDSKPILKAEDLKAQAPDFAGAEGLLAYLDAAQAFYVERQAAAALERLGPAPTGALTPPRLAFSREILRGEALLALGRGEEANAHWRQLLAKADLPWEKEAVELGAAFGYERQGQLNKAFEGETRLASSRLRALLLRHAAGPILLREAVANPQSTERERALARFVLLFKEATHGQYKNFLRDFTPEARKDQTDTSLGSDRKPSLFAAAGETSDYPCPAFAAVMQALAAHPEAAHGRLCLADFMRAHALESFDAAAPSDELGGAKPLFPGAAYSPNDAYQAVLADGASPAVDRAYALYRLVNCYATSGYNHCGGKPVELPQRKAWFQMLKTKYADTSWAKAQRIYW